MNSLNLQNKRLKTIENNSLQFLDRLIYIDEKHIPQFKTYHKKCNESNSNEKDVKNALEYVKTKYRNLNFPENLIKK
jgi:hypothetical protein